MQEQEKENNTDDPKNNNNNDLEDIISNLTNTDDDIKILLLNKLKETKETICNSFRKQYEEKEQECEQFKKKYNNLQKTPKENIMDKTKENEDNNIDVKSNLGPIKDNEKNKEKITGKDENIKIDSCQQLLLDDLIRRCTKKIDCIQDEYMKENVNRCLKRVRQDPTDADKILLLQSLIQLTKKQKVDSTNMPEKKEQTNPNMNDKEKKSNLEKILEECRQLDKKYIHPLLAKKENNFTNKSDKIPNNNNEKAESIIIDNSNKDKLLSLSDQMKINNTNHKNVPIIMDKIPVSIVKSKKYDGINVSIKPIRKIE